MSLSRSRIEPLLLACLFLMPMGLRAQQSGAGPAERSAQAERKPTAQGGDLNEQQRRGEALFVQNCPLCHVPSKQKKRLGIQGPILAGVYSEDSEETPLRQIIEQGVAGKMPAFRYALDQKQVDDLVAFLRAGANLKTSGSSD